MKENVDILYSDNNVTLFCGDIFDCLKYLPKNTIQAVITSPTYWGKRRFTNDKREFGSEKLEEYIDKNVRLFSSLLNLMKKEGSIFDVNNGITVCRSCHKIIHYEIGIKTRFPNQIRKGFG